VLDIDRIRQLIEMMVANDLVQLSLRDGEVEVNLRRPNPKAEPVLTTVTAASPATVMVPSTGGGTPPVAGPTLAAEASMNLHEIRSPMVGTFYAGPDPDSPPFVQVGSSIGPSSVVCLLEAMKVFSEIKAETAGSIERVLARDGEAVEYGQPLFLVRAHG